MAVRTWSVVLNVRLEPLVVEVGHANRSAVLWTLGVEYVDGLRRAFSEEMCFEAHKNHFEVEIRRLV